MPRVRARPGELAVVLMKRFKKACETERLRDQMKRAATYEKPSDLRRRKKNQQARRASTRPQPRGGTTAA
jgi:ribosomal protein S21